jgi:phosphohistidine phosphatase
MRPLEWMLDKSVIQRGASTFSDCSEKAMPRLLLLRHAKAERAKAGEKDRARALSKRGERQAAAMGTVIAERDERPDLVLCSDSARTRQTWEGVEPELANSPEVRFLRSLYEADDYLDILRAEGDRAESILLIGHNPAIQETAALLAADRAAGKAAEMSSHFPTAALAIFEFDGKWRTLGPRRMRLLDFLTPPEGERG